MAPAVGSVAVLQQEVRAQKEQDIRVYCQGEEAADGCRGGCR